MKKLTRHPVRFKGLTVGLDVHKKFIEHVILDRQGDQIAGGRVPSSPEGLSKVFGIVGRRKVQFVLEACGFYLWVYDFLSHSVGKEHVHVAQPHRIRAIANSQEKNDPNDAWWLAYLRFEGRLPVAYVPEGDLRELRIASRELRWSVNCRSDQIRRFRSHLAQEGVQLKATNFQTQVGRSEAKEILEGRSGMRRAALSSLLQAIEESDERIRLWQERVGELSRSFPDIETMIEKLPGFGRTLAPIVYAELGDPRRYWCAKALARATGLAPGYRESGGRRMPTRISRGGSNDARWAFTRAVIACMRCKQGPGLSVKYWVLRRLEKQPKKKVYVAAARKLAEALWRLFALGEEFDLTKAFPGAKRPQRAA
jgi:transposase